MKPRFALLAVIATGAAPCAGVCGASVSHGMGDYTLSITGDCPGRITLEWTGATPDHLQAVLASHSEGRTLLRGGPCAGTTLGLGRSGLWLVNVIGTGTGSGTINANTFQHCGLPVQLIEGGTCRTTNVVRAP